MTDAVVYFLRAEGVNLIKIGCSADPERRFAELRLLSPVALHVIGIVGGGFQRERELHAQFAHLNSHGEWYFAAPELLSFACRESLKWAWDNSSEEVREWFREWIDRKPIFDRTPSGRAA